MAAVILVIAVLAWLFHGGDGKASPPATAPAPDAKPDGRTLQDYAKSEAVQQPASRAPQLLGPPPKRMPKSLRDWSALEGE